MCRSKHVEQLRNTGIINSTTRSHLVCYFYKIYKIGLLHVLYQRLAYYTYFTKDWLITRTLPKLCLLFNFLKAESSPICHLLALLGAHYILHVSTIRIKNHTKGSRYWCICCLFQLMHLYNLKHQLTLTFKTLKKKC